MLCERCAIHDVAMEAAAPIKDPSPAADAVRSAVSMFDPFLRLPAEQYEHSTLPCEVTHAPVRGRPLRVRRQVGQRAAHAPSSLVPTAPGAGLRRRSRTARARAPA